MSHQTRRSFLNFAFKTTAKIAIANSVLYAVGTSFKDFDGKLVAGAKSCSWVLANSCYDSPGVGDPWLEWENYDGSPCAPADNRRVVCAGAGDACGRVPKCNQYVCTCY